MRKWICLLLVCLIPCISLAEGDWANADLPRNRMPEYIETVPWNEIGAGSPGQHHYLLLCIDQW